MASFSIQSYTDTSVTIKVTGITKNQTVRFYVRINPGSTAYVDKTYTATSTTMTKTLSGLSESTSYACNVQIDGDGWIGTQYFTTDESTASVDPWDWDSSNGNATASQTKSAYKAITNNGNVSDFSYLVWNDMVDKVKEVLDANGDSWNEKYATYANTRMSSSSKTLTAAKFNSLRYNVGLHVSTGISEVSKGDIVYGWYFTTIMNCINKYI
jgi:hypothetical protein